MKLQPTEEEEQKAFVDWLNAKKYPHHHSPNEGGGGRQNAIRGARMKRLGTSKGFWDLIIFLPVKGITGTIDSYQPIMIEMKVQKGGQVSSEQRSWGHIYEKAGIPCRICKGAGEAIAFVEEIKKEIR